MKTAIYVNSANKINDARIFAGIKSFASGNGWDVHQINMFRTREDIAKVKSLWRPDGFIVNRSADRNNLPLSVFGKTQVVFIGSSKRAAQPDETSLVNDAADTARHAARELLSLELSRYAYVGWLKRATWSERRREAFSDILEQHGFKPTFFDTARRGENEPECIAALAKWLKGLGGPAGVFAANDHVATLVLSACAVARLSVPQDVAIVGVDNDEATCEGARTSLSSVEIDFFAAGHLAAEALARLMSRRPVPPDLLLCPALRLVRRAPAPHRSRRPRTRQSCRGRRTSPRGRRATASSSRTRPGATSSTTAPCRPRASAPCGTTRSSRTPFLQPLARLTAFGCGGLRETLVPEPAKDVLEYPGTFGRRDRPGVAVHLAPALFDAGKEFAVAEAPREVGPQRLVGRRGPARSAEGRKRLLDGGGDEPLRCDPFHAHVRAR